MGLALTVAAELLHRYKASRLLVSAMQSDHKNNECK